MLNVARFPRNIGLTALPTKDVKTKHWRELDPDPVIGKLPYVPWVLPSSEQKTGMWIWSRSAASVGSFYERDI